VATTDTFRSTYGALTSVLALVVGAYLTAVALLFGVAFCAQIEAARANTREPTNAEERQPPATTGVIPPPRWRVREGDPVPPGP
jgi:uncharacterized BrkB/YihY/UPF0761 family membrane protein